MLGPEEAKKFMYGSDHASHVHAETDAIHVSNIDGETFDGITVIEKQEIMSAARGINSIKSRLSLKNKDEISISAHGTEVGHKQTKKMKWNSVRQNSVKQRAKAELETDGVSHGTYGGASSISPGKL